MMRILHLVKVNDKLQGAYKYMVLLKAGKSTNFLNILKKMSQICDLSLSYLDFFNSPALWLIFIQIIKNKKILPKNVR